MGGGAVHAWAIASRFCFTAAKGRHDLMSVNIVCLEIALMRKGTGSMSDLAKCWLEGHENVEHGHQDSRAAVGFCQQLLVDRDAPRFVGSMCGTGLVKGRGDRLCAAVGTRPCRIFLEGEETPTADS